MVETHPTLLSGESKLCNQIKKFFSRKPVASSTIPTGVIMPEVIPVKRPLIMKLDLLRYYSDAELTLGMLFIDKTFVCYTLEDEFREVKIKGDTRIPNGTYEIVFRDSPKFSPKYKHLMLELKDVPGFEAILIHKGNTEVDTAGCLLVGNGVRFVPVVGKSFLEDSGLAYDRIYPLIAAKVKEGLVEIKISELRA